MKRIKGRYDLIQFYFFPFSTLTILLYVFYFKHLYNIALCNWLFSLVLLVIIFLPKANTPLGEQKTNAKVKWGLALFSSQLLMNMIVWSFSKIISIDLINNDTLTPLNISLFSLQNGLFPWGFSTFLAVTMGFFTYHEKRLGLVSSAFEPLFKNTHMDSVGVAVDGYMRFIPTFTSIMIFSLMSFSLILLLRMIWQFPLSVGLTLQFYLAASSLLLLAIQQQWIKLLHKLNSKGIPTVIILLIIVLLISILYPLLSIISHFLVKLSPFLDITIYKPNALFIHSHNLLLIIFLWFALSMLTGAFIAYQSRNKTIRQVIVGMLLSFLISLGVVMGLEEIYQQVDAAKALPLFVILISGIIFHIFFLNKNNYTYFLRATLPFADKPIKKRSLYRYFKIISINISLILCAYLGIGAPIWSLFLVFGYLPALVIIVISYVGFLSKFFSSFTGRLG